MNVRPFLYACLVSASAFACTSTVEAQLVQYKFTGTRVGGNADFGGAIFGVVTLDLAASPYVTQPSSGGGCGQYAVWRSVDGNFTYDAMTSNGQTGGTSLGGNTYFEAIDDPCRPILYGNLHCNAVVAGHEIGMYFITQDPDDSGNGIAEVSDWTPLDDAMTYIRIYDQDLTTLDFQYSNYELDTFELVRDTIVIDGRDTGVEDFEYDGELVSERIEAYADGAKSHGQFVSQVNKLTRELAKAGLLSPEERDAIQDAASDSSIGKRPGRSKKG